ncbi:MAG: SRPBCC family protein [Pseudomonadota bacterium]
MIKKIVIAITAIIAIIVGMAVLQPDTFAVQRQITIKAPPEKIVAMINDFHNWSSWSPWEHLDPGMKRSFSGAASGKGAVYGWDGNKDVGAGRMEITDQTLPSKVLIQLDFIRPFEGHDVNEFVLDGKGDSTTVTWKMSGPMPFVSKVMCVFYSMDKMIGKDFEKGLAAMKAQAEKA